MTPLRKPYYLSHFYAFPRALVRGCDATMRDGSVSSGKYPAAWLILPIADDPCAESHNCQDAHANQRPFAASVERNHISPFLVVLCSRGGVLSCVRFMRVPFLERELSTDKFCSRTPATNKTNKINIEGRTGLSDGSMAIGSASAISRSLPGPTRPRTTFHFTSRSMPARRGDGLLMTMGRRPKRWASSSPRLCGGFTSADRSAA